MISTLLLLLSALATADPHLVLNDQTHVNRPLFDVKVPVQLGVMSKCPDALLCETTFNAVLDKVKDKIALSLVYVAKINRTEPDFGVTCMHGPEECSGNVQQLCVDKYSNKGQWWSFIRCQNFEGRGMIGKPDVALRCAKAAEVDWETSGAGECAGLDGSGRGAEGVKLLHESVRLGQYLNITKSCTVLINGRKVCVHDGTWKDCENGHTVNDFVRQINKEYDELNSIEM